MERVWIVRGDGETLDEYGDPVATSPERLALDVWGVEPRTGGDVAELGRNGYTDGFVIYAPPPATADAPRVQPSDRIEVRGRLYDLVGVVGEWRNPFAPGIFDGDVFVVGKGVG